MCRSNYVKTTRSTVEFTVSIASGKYSSEPFPYRVGDFAGGYIAPSGGVPAAAGTTISFMGQDYWGNYNHARPAVSGFTGMVVEFPSANVIHILPPHFFGLIGSARACLSNGSGSAVLATAAIVFSMGLKS